MSLVNDRPLIIYHAPCLDGFTAAWAAWLKYPDAEFVEGVHGQPQPKVAGRRVYLLDFSYKAPVLEAMASVADHITILDHHASAQRELADFIGNKYANVSCGFDMEKSGARLAWEWFHPGTEVPYLVRVVEDRDLWRFTLEDSKAINAALFSYEFVFHQWNVVREMLITMDGRDHVVAEGQAIERKHMKDVRELVSKTRHMRKFTKTFVDDGVLMTVGPVIPCANLPYTMSSDAAGMMAEGHPFAATYYFDGEQYVFSLRSREGGVDVSEVAVRYGGGGHKGAAGFRVKSLEEL